jgi:2-dehydro-3-deoxygalactonokinase
MLTETPGRELAIVPGVRCVDAAGVPDVMRGEETQLAGALNDDEATVLAVLPGTHSKWAMVDRGILVDFATFMTGELYAILLADSILGRMACDHAGASSAGGAAFTRGVACGSSLLPANWLQTRPTGFQRADRRRNTRPGVGRERVASMRRCA